jgi:hypothetical protein
MIRAEYKDKERIVEILTNSFQDNKSVNYILKQDQRRLQRVRNLMDYSFEVCYLFGDVFLSEDKTGCALIVLPEKKKTTLKSVLLDVKLIFTCTGLSNVKKTLDRESKIKKLHPTEPMYYLWFIGVDNNKQNKGVGSRLLEDVIQQASLKNRTTYLETSTLKNIPWYEKFGFKVYNELDLGYRLYFLRRE